MPGNEASTTTSSNFKAGWTCPARRYTIVDGCDLQKTDVVSQSHNQRKPTANCIHKVSQFSAFFKNPSYPPPPPPSMLPTASCKTGQGGTGGEEGVTVLRSRLRITPQRASFTRQLFNHRRRPSNRFRLPSNCCRLLPNRCHRRLPHEDALCLGLPTFLFLFFFVTGGAGGI